MRGAAERVVGANERATARILAPRGLTRSAAVLGPSATGLALGQSSSRNRGPPKHAQEHPHDVRQSSGSVGQHLRSVSLGCPGIEPDNGPTIGSMRRG
ncbi:MAG: hypothetical protein ACK56I_20810, partial [bacterium]